MTGLAVEHDLLRASQYCRDLTRRRARNFYYGLKLAPEPQRSALFAMYAWMRRADDLSDDPAFDDRAPRERIESFRAATDAALDGQVTDGDPLWVALAHTAARFDIARRDLHDMLDGQAADLTARRYESFEELRQYCYRVASTVGLVCVSIWGHDDPRARPLAIDRGIAFQLTNILRDFRQDFDAGRCYLPREEFAHHALTPDELRQWSRPDACAGFVLEQVDRAANFYRQAEALDSMITASCVPTSWAMTTIYRGLLEKIRARPQRIVSPRRLRLSAWHKGAIALRAGLMARPARNGAVPPPSPSGRGSG